MMKQNAIKQLANVMDSLVGSARQMHAMSQNTAIVLFYTSICITYYIAFCSAFVLFCTEYCAFNYGPHHRSYATLYQHHHTLHFCLQMNLTMSQYIYNRDKRRKLSARLPCVVLQRCKCVDIHRSGERASSGPTKGATKAVPTGPTKGSQQKTK